MEAPSAQKGGNWRGEGPHEDKCDRSEDKAGDHDAVVPLGVRQGPHEWPKGRVGHVDDGKDDANDLSLTIRSFCKCRDRMVSTQPKAPVPRKRMRAVSDTRQVGTAQICWRKVASPSPDESPWTDEDRPRDLSLPGPPRT